MTLNRPLPRDPVALILAMLILPVMVACGSPPPDPPANQRYGYEGTNVVVKWDASAGADSYTVYYSDDSFPECQPDSDGSSCQGLANGIQRLAYTHASPGPQRNSYWVAACNDSGCSEVDSGLPARPPPPSPLSARTALEGTSILVVWNPVPEATHYRVYTGPSRGCDIHRGCAVLDENVVGTAYTHDSPRSLQPWPPSGIKVVDRTQASLTVAWQPDTRAPDLDNYWVAACDDAGCSKKTRSQYSSSTHDSLVGIDYYQVNRRSQEGGRTLLDSKPVGSPYVDGDLQPDAIYYYAVQACNDSGCSAESDETGGLTESDGPVDAPSVPEVLGHKYDVSLGPDNAGVSWSPVERATYYKVYQGSDLDQEVSAPGTSYRDNAPNSGVFGEYAATSYRVRACNKTGCSPFSEFITIH